MTDPPRSKSRARRIVTALIIVLVIVLIAVGLVALYRWLRSRSKVNPAPTPPDSGPKIDISWILSPLADLLDATIFKVATSVPLSFGGGAPSTLRQGIALPSVQQVSVGFSIPVLGTYHVLDADISAIGIDSLALDRSRTTMFIREVSYCRLDSKVVAVCTIELVNPKLRIDLHNLGPILNLLSPWNGWITLKTPVQVAATFTMPFGQPVDGAHFNIMGIDCTSFTFSPYGDLIALRNAIVDVLRNDVGELSTLIGAADSTVYSVSLGQDGNLVSNSIASLILDAITDSVLPLFCNLLGPLLPSSNRPTPLTTIDISLPWAVSVPYPYYNACAPGVGSPTLLPKPINLDFSPLGLCLDVSTFLVPAGTYRISIAADGAERQLWVTPEYALALGAASDAASKWSYDPASGRVWQTLAYNGAVTPPLYIQANSPRVAPMTSMQRFTRVYVSAWYGFIAAADSNSVIWFLGVAGDPSGQPRPEWVLPNNLVANPTRRVAWKITPAAPA